MNKITFNNEVWEYHPIRKFPQDAKLSVRRPYNTSKYTSKWKDLCWYNGARDIWTYISTLPA